MPMAGFFRVCVSIVFLVVFSTVFVTAQSTAKHEDPAFDPTPPGLIDFRARSFPDSGVADLSGDWFIFWNKLLPPESFEAMARADVAAHADGVFSIPRTWNNWEYNDRPVGGQGYATFVVDLLLPRGMDRAALWIPNASTAYALWVDGDLVAHNGVPGRNREDSRPHYVMKTAGFPVTDGRARIVLQLLHRQAKI